MNTIRRLQRQLVVSHKAILCIINTIKYYYTSPHNETKEQLCTDWVSCKHWSMMFLCTLIHFCLTANKFVDTELFTNFFFTKKATLLKNTSVTRTGPYCLCNHILEALWRVNITQATWPWKSDVRQTKRPQTKRRKKICWDCNNNTVKYQQGYCFLLGKRNGGLSNPHWAHMHPS